MSRGTRSGSGSVVFSQTYGSARPIAYTPTVTWAGNTITTQSGFYMKTPGKLELWVSFVETAGVVSASLTVSLPTTISVTAVTHTASISAGVGQFGASVVSGGIEMVIAAGGTTQLVSSLASTGAVGTWYGNFTIPTLT